MTHTDDSLSKFITDQLEKQQNNLARGRSLCISLHFNDDKLCSVVGVQQDYVRLSLEDVLYPDGITSNNVEYEKLKKQTKWVTEHYNAYKGNYSGNIDFDKEDGSKNSYLYKQ